MIYNLVHHSVIIHNVTTRCSSSWVAH